MTYVFENDGPPVTGPICYIPGPGRFTQKGGANTPLHFFLDNQATQYPPLVVLPEVRLEPTTVVEYGGSGTTSGRHLGRHFGL